MFYKSIKLTRSTSANYKKGRVLWQQLQGQTQAAGRWWEGKNKSCTKTSSVTLMPPKCWPQREYPERITVVGCLCLLLFQKHYPKTYISYSITLISITFAEFLLFFTFYRRESKCRKRIALFHLLLVLKVKLSYHHKHTDNNTFFPDFCFVESLIPSWDSSLCFYKKKKKRAMTASFLLVLHILNIKSQQWQSHSARRCGM